MEHKHPQPPAFIPFFHQRLEEVDMIERSIDFCKRLSGRRSVRHFSRENIPYRVLEECLMAAGSAPSGANKQPWTFCVISNSELKKKIRLAAEAEEYESYHGRMSETWLRDLKPLGTCYLKPFLEDAPYLIVVFKRIYEWAQDGSKTNNYYVNESVGIAVGMLLTALHLAGLATLTHTPSPMNFLTDILGRPNNERAYLVIPVGYPHPDAEVPNIVRKPVNEIVMQYF